MIAKGKKLAYYLPNILAEDSEKNTSFFLPTTWSSGPGGGFIGSYGILTMKDLTFEGIQVYDVYDADGQLTAHVKPQTPSAIIFHNRIGSCETRLFHQIFMKTIFKQNFS